MGRSDPSVRESETRMRHVSPERPLFPLHVPRRVYSDTKGCPVLNVCTEVRDHLNHNREGRASCRVIGGSASSCLIYKRPTPFLCTSFSLLLFLPPTLSLSVSVSVSFLSVYPSLSHGLCLTTLRSVPLFLTFPSLSLFLFPSFSLPLSTLRLSHSFCVRSH